MYLIFVSLFLFLLFVLFSVMRVGAGEKCNIEKGFD